MKKNAEDRAKRVTITVYPRDLKIIDKLSKEAGESRSGYFSGVASGRIKVRDVSLDVPDGNIRLRVVVQELRLVVELCDIFLKRDPLNKISHFQTESDKDAQKGIHVTIVIFTEHQTHFLEMLEGLKNQKSTVVEIIARF